MPTFELPTLPPCRGSLAQRGTNPDAGFVCQLLLLKGSIDQFAVGGTTFQSVSSKMALLAPGLLSTFSSSQIFAHGTLRQSELVNAKGRVTSALRAECCKV